MKISADRRILADVMGVITGVVNPRHANPMLQNVLIDATNKELILRATDLEISIQQKVIETEVEEPGQVLLQAARLAGILKDMSADTVELTRDGDTVVITSGRDRLTLQSSDVESFPSFPEFKAKGALKIKASVVEDALHRTSRAIAQEKGRYAFNGVLMMPKKNVVEFVGTEGRRLAYCCVTTKCREYDFQIIIPKRGCELFSRMAARFTEEEFLFDIRENQIIARINEAVVSSHLVEGQYPDYWSVIPRNHDKLAVANREKFISGLRLATHATSIDSQGVKMEISGDEMTLITRSSGTGSADVRVPITYKGEDLTIGFDSRLLSEGLALMKAEDVTIEFADTNTGVIYHEGNKDEFFYLVMPLEVD